MITDCERKLDLLDREIDERVGHAVTLADVATARELLVCMKFLVDLERIGDLLSSVGTRIQMMDHGVEMADVRDLIGNCAGSDVAECAHGLGEARCGPRDRYCSFRRRD